MVKKTAEAKKIEHKTESEAEHKTTVKHEKHEKSDAKHDAKHEKHDVKHDTKHDSKHSKHDTILPELNIGMVGHVDHGKTTLVKALSGKWTSVHSEEIKRGITIRLGYADVSFYKCTKCNDYGVTPECKCGGKAEFVKKASLVDAPGHESLMATMLCGANIMDGAILLVSATEKCPMPQTQEHLMALQIIGMKNVIVVQNKIDLVSDERAQANYQEIKDMLKGTSFEDAPIIPMSAVHSINLDMLVKTLVETFKVSSKDAKKSPRMYVARSFDINKPGTLPSQLKGGVIGGVLKQGELHVGDEIEILPGYEVEERNTKIWKPLKTKITGILAGGGEVSKIGPGGTFALLTKLDPNIVKSDKLAGAVVGKPKELPAVISTLKLEIHLLERIVGAKDQLVVAPIIPKELLMLNVYSMATVGMVEEVAKGKAVFKLRRPVCAEPGARVAMSRNVGQRWRLIGYGVVI